MFKKKESVVLAPAHLVSGADRKKLARRLEGLSGMPNDIAAGTANTLLSEISRTMDYICLRNSLLPTLPPLTTTIQCIKTCL